MAHYDYQCVACGHTFELNVPIAQRNDACEAPCPVCYEPGDGHTIERVLGAPAVSYSYGGVRKKTPEAFKDVLRNIKKNHHGSTIDV